MSHFSGNAQEMDEGTNLECDTVAGCAGTILYVEDEAFVREVVAEVLQAAGYRVLIAKNAAEAIDTFHGWGPEVDLLLTDVILPGETGHVLAARLRHANSRLEVLYVTGYSEQMGMRSSANEDCLAKPFSTEALLQRVRRMIVQKDYQAGRENAVMLACAGA